MVKNRLISSIVVVFLLFPTLRGTEQELQESPSFFKSVLADEGEILTSPFKLKSKHLLTWGSVAVLTVVLIKNDEDLYRRAKLYQEKHEWVDKLSPKLTILGDGNVNLGIAGLFCLGGLVFKDKKALKTGELSVMSLIHAGIVVQLLKHLSGRQRPEAQDGIDHWAGPAGFFKRYKDHRDMLYDSFPSGHTITAWSVATVIAKMYNKSFVVPALCYSLATLSGLSRVTEDKHWFSDVLVGAALGYAIGNFVVKKRGGRFNVLPMVEDQKVGLSINYSLD